MAPRWQLPTDGLTSKELDRFWSSVDKTSHPGHWIWTGTTMTGKPYFGMRGDHVSPNRITWALEKGGMVPRRLNKTCNVKECVRPDHLFGLPYVEKPDPYALPTTVAVTVEETVKTFRHHNFEPGLEGFEDTCRKCGGGTIGHPLCLAYAEYPDTDGGCKQSRGHKGNCGDARRILGGPNEERAATYIETGITPLLICRGCKHELQPENNHGDEKKPLCARCDGILNSNIEGPVAIPIVPAMTGVVGPSENGATIEEMVSGFRTLDAFAAMDYDKVPAVHKIRKLRAPEDPPHFVKTPDGMMPVVVPEGVVESTLTPAARRSERLQPISLQEVLDVVFAPHTVITTFPSGTILISGAGNRILAEDPYSAIHAVLVNNGKRRIAG